MALTTHHVFPFAPPSTVPESRPSVGAALGVGVPPAGTGQALVQEFCVACLATTFLSQALLLSGE